jgi:hypothetical protein
MGPVQQIKSMQFLVWAMCLFFAADMTQRERLVPSLVYVAAMVMTLVAALAVQAPGLGWPLSVLTSSLLQWQKTLLAMCFVLVQVAAAFWYAISCKGPLMPRTLEPRLIRRRYSLCPELRLEFR